MRCAGQAGDCAFVNQGFESFAESSAGGADVPRQGGFGLDVAADIILQGDEHTAAEITMAHEAVVKLWIGG